MNRPIQLKRIENEESSRAPYLIGTVRLTPEAEILFREIAARANMSLRECASEIILQSRDLIDVMADKPLPRDPTQEIVAAVRADGEQGGVTIVEKTPGRSVVYVDKSYYGIWDSARRTFVD